MDRLSSCYFCGDATDATLDEFPVIPDVLEPTAESQTTVVLCGDCRRKLDAVVERIVDAADDSGSGVSAGDGTRTRSRAGTDSSPADEADTDDVEATLAGGEDVLRSVDDGADEASDDGDAPTSADDAESSDSNRALDDEGDAETDSPDGNPAAPTADDGGAPESSSADDGDDEPSLTRLEYNKVMRLLQNRELPVERQGFVNVAANAYELDPRECERVLDVAIENGLIGEESGQLVEPED
jgi:hypothetical protein